MSSFWSHGTRIFLRIWSGQLISSIGSGMTSFAINVWIYQQSHSMQRLAWMVLAATLPGILCAPLAGAAADRWDRRWIMIFSSVGAGLSTLFLAANFFLGSAPLWHIYLGIGGISFFAAFQWPACIAASTLLIPQEHYARASGLWQFAQAITMMAAPPLALVLIPSIGMHGVILGDFVSYLIAIGILLTVRIPKPAAIVADLSEKPSLLREVSAGWAYIRDRQGLVQLMVFGFIVLFAISMSQVLLVPLVLNVASAKALAVIIAVATIGMVIGSAVIASWGGPQHRILGVLGSGFALGVALFLTGFQRGPVPIAVGLFVLGCVVPTGISCAQAIWQSKTEPTVQGRVFALRGMLNQACLPLACLVAAPLADRLFSPLLVTGGLLAGTVGRFTGVGPGQGVGLLMTSMGVLSVTAASLAWFSPRFRRVERELPDVIVLQAVPVAMEVGVGQEIAELERVG